MLDSLQPKAWWLKVWLDHCVMTKRVVAMPNQVSTMNITTLLLSASGHRWCEREAGKTHPTEVIRNSAKKATGIGSTSRFSSAHRCSTEFFRGTKLLPPKSPMRRVNCSGVGRSGPSLRFDSVTIRLAAKKATEAMMELER